jgi:hypothetical protein
MQALLRVKTDSRSGGHGEEDTGDKKDKTDKDKEDDPLASHIHLFLYLFLCVVWRRITERYTVLYGVELTT